MRCYLDLGLQKTGSKARQQFFASELARVRGARLFFPSAGREWIWHKPLYQALSAGNRAPLDELSREVAARRNEADGFILSYEELHKWGPREIAWIGEAFADIRAAVFLRRQDQLVNSFHNQRHKSHRESLRTLEAYEAGMLDYDPALDHAATLQRWTAGLGREAVAPILFDKSASPVASFFGRLGLDVDLQGYAEGYPNRAIDAFGMSVMRWVKRLARNDAELPLLMDHAHAALAAHFAKPGNIEERYSLSFAQRRRIMRNYAASNEWVRAEFFPERAGLFPPLEEAGRVAVDYAQGRELAERIVAAARRDASA